VPEGCLGFVKGSCLGQGGPNGDDSKIEKIGPNALNGLVVGVSIGAFLVIVIVAFAVYYHYYKRKVFDFNQKHVSKSDILIDKETVAFKPAVVPKPDVVHEPAVVVSNPRSNPSLLIINSTYSRSFDPLGLSATITDFVNLKLSLEDKILQLINGKSGNLKSLKSLFFHEHGFKIPKNQEVILGYTMNKIISKVLHFFEDFHDANIDMKGWKTIYEQYSFEGESEFKSKFFTLQKCITEELDEVLNDLFSIEKNSMGSSHALLFLSNGLVRLILKCLANGSKPFIASAKEGKYSCKDVHWQNNIDNVVVLFPSYWSVRNNSEIIFKSDMVFLTKQ
jgi:hypothetical protein